MNPKDILKTTITKPFSTFTFNYSCFGLRSAGATFQQLWMASWETFPPALRRTSVTSDRGTTSILQLWMSLNCLLGTQLHCTAAYHPESNGMVELKAALMSCCNSSTWYLQLPWVLLALWTTPKEGFYLSAAEMVYGNPLVIPGEFFPDNNPSPDIFRLRTIVGKFAPDRPSYKPTNNTFIPKDLHTATHVFNRTDAV
ncbi:uncharacterized protein [Macrobrachium rosenbergii]|uniref:uncharacterized protein n=1 Tax=Macrobrachium rosenbergii TaxID=79674 RepID=UPI0034D3BC0E